MSIELITLIMFGSLIVCLILGLPLVWTLGGIAVAATIFAFGPGHLLTIIFNIFGVMWNIIFICIPLFIFMGVLLERSGVADALYETIFRWSGPVRGGLAMGTVVICAVFAAMTGITAAATVTMGLIAVPAMLKRNYDKSLALGTVTGAGTLGILIPPSVSMILIAGIASLSVGKLFMAGFIPGIVLALLFITYIGIKGLLQPKSCPAHGERFTLRQKVVSLRAVIAPLFVIAAVSGTIFGGIATPTEASAAGAAAVLIITAFRRRLTWQLIREATLTTFRISSMVLWIAFAAVAFTATYTALGGMQFVTELVMRLEVSRWLALIVIMLVTFFLGMFLDVTGLIFLITPIAFPIIEVLGFDPIWFGIIFVINLQMGYITPPFGYNLFYMKSVVPPDISMADIYRSIFPFLGVMILGMALVMIFPQLALWLPTMMIKVAG